MGGMPTNQQLPSTHARTGYCTQATMWGALLARVPPLFTMSCTISRLWAGGRQAGGDP